MYVRESGPGLSYPRPGLRAQARFRVTSLVGSLWPNLNLSPQLLVRFVVVIPHYLIICGIEQNPRIHCFEVTVAE